ncbi:hypothetical protein [uncultured Granulicatella sp.]|uniref:hypothetical protein n=1 Tax=uncultured Granulicatella sp. TaxID=316089 RepID=UPI0028DB55DD|nr:hypothetical protein [uncultured Granulicatella sp.]
MNEKDLYQTFIEAEKFYYDKFWLGVIGVALILFFLWVMVLYANKKQKIISLLLAMFLIIPTGIYLVRNFLQYQSTIQWISQLTPAVREYVRKPFSKEHYSVFEQESYRGKNNPNQYPDQLYQKAQIQEGVVYLGKDRNFIYVQIGNDSYKVSKDLLEIRDTVSSASRIATQYMLKDERFTQEGFVKASAIFLEKIVIPKELESLEVDASIANALKSSTKKMGTWTIS